MKGLFEVEVVIVLGVAEANTVVVNLEAVTLDVVSMDIVIDVEAGFKIVEMLVVLAKLLWDTLMEDLEVVVKVGVAPVDNIFVVVVVKVELLVIAVVVISLLFLEVLVLLAVEIMEVV